MLTPSDVFKYDDYEAIFCTAEYVFLWLLDLKEVLFYLQDEEREKMSSFEIERDSIIGKGQYQTVEAVLDSFHTAAATANLQTYFGCFHAQGRFLGTDATENWHVNEFYAFSKPYFQRSTSAWTYTPIAGSRKITFFPTASSDAAAIQPFLQTAAGTNPTVFAIFDELLDSESFKATSRGSGTLLYQPGQGWLVASYHLSFPIPNDIAKDLTKVIHTFEQSLKTKQANKAAEELLAELALEEAQTSQTSNNKKKKSNKKK